MVKAGQVVDAIRDLQRALELAPNRLEAHAELARAYMNLGDEAKAMSEWELAMPAADTEPSWYAQYGKLLLENGKALQAKGYLQKAVDAIPEDQEQETYWVFDAHRNLAIAMGPVRAAIPHWQKFVENRPNSPYAREALDALTALVARYR
ncbi:MAG: tetratricopeptide repeat protein [Polyangiaceae bacterium]|nr:tetratricopeptide repeat protein [Polyangiaceae bacterium]